MVPELALLITKHLVNEGHIYSKVGKLEYLPSAINKAHDNANESQAT